MNRVLLTRLYCILLLLFYVLLLFLLGYFQPEIVRDMVDRKRLLIEEVSFDFHSSCSYSNSFSLAREVNLSLLDKTGIFPPYQNEYSCLQTVRNFYINETLLGSLNGPLVGNKLGITYITAPIVLLGSFNLQTLRNAPRGGGGKQSVTAPFLLW